MRFLPFLLVFCAVNTTLAAKPASHFNSLKEDLHIVDLWLDSQRDYKQIPGLAVGIVVDHIAALCPDLT